MLTRRSALFLLATPAIVRAASLMPVRALTPSPWTLYLDGREFYVDPTSLSLPGIGTRDQPWRTLQQAVDYLGVRGFGKEITIHLASGEVEKPFAWSFVAESIRASEG